MQNSNRFPSVNKLVEPLVQNLINDASALQVRIDKLTNGATVIDTGIDCDGSIEAGRRVIEICLGGLGKAQIKTNDTFKNWRWSIDVYTSHPVIACLAGQYAGWSLEHGTGKDAFKALGSGPARAMGSSEGLFEELGYHDKCDSASIVLEVGEMPPVEIADQVAEKCGIKADKLTIILTPTTSLAGSIQVVGRSLEVALHKVHELGFPLYQVKDGFGSAPICPVHSNFIKAMGRTNDAILFGGDVHLYVDYNDEDAKDLAHNLPSSNSKDYGKPFAQIFKDSGYNFYKIDPMLFSPAKVTVTNIKTGNTFRAGRLDEELLNQSFG